MHPTEQAFWVGVIVVVPWGIYLWLTTPSEHDGITPWERIRARYFITSNEPILEVPEPDDYDTSTDGSYQCEPDTNAVRGGSVQRTSTKVSSQMSDDQLLALLAIQKAPDGKWRVSANKVADVVGGTRAIVLAQIRAIRSEPPPAEYPPLTEEQVQARRDLGLQ